MADFVPYTRKVIQRIRNGASAKDLGWSDSMYDGICRSHGIERPKKRAAVVQRADGRDHVVDFRRRSGEIIRADIIVALSPVQAEAFGVLYDLYLTGEQRFISAFEVSGCLKKECSARNVVNMFTRMSDRLAPLKCWIEVKTGSHGGFRLRVDP
jgi:hypothetical protein